MTSKIKIRFGEIEIECEGSEEFIKQELPQLMKEIAALHKSAPPPKTNQKTAKTANGDDAAESVTTVAQRLGVATGPDLIMATAFKLAGSGSDSFERKDLRSGVKGATTFYKNSYGTNFDKALKKLVKDGRIHHAGGTTYSLPNGERVKLLAKMAPQS